ncbi:hypothetical protein EV356DRAFT_31834 [Viridothelium virens]|uniref:Mis14-domain-containing protein n=1 Tax=Viridothelium virens TaxID=1048519 RepID=A0A6A6HHM1_VIRVR|nr:hypothetical protein EV356DRAFT_31834 [Viridothelium virens]
METESAHRRIELQSTADLHYLRSNARRAARGIIDLHLPPTAALEGGEEEDELRRGVESLVEQYIKNTFLSARHSISINGLEPSATERVFFEDEPQAGDEAYEPYDTRLASRLTTLANTHNELILSLANLRRTAPAQAARSFQTNYEAHSSGLNSLTKAETERLNKQSNDYELNIGKLERWDDVEKTYERGTQGLLDLKSGLTETVARCERAVEAANEVER